VTPFQNNTTLTGNNFAYNNNSSNNNNNNDSRKSGSVLYICRKLNRPYEGRFVAMRYYYNYQHALRENNYNTRKASW
jgi:hypothetical protein